MEGLAVQTSDCSPHLSLVCYCDG